MKVAIITAGQPRFTQDFITVLNQLKGFETADLYINLWNSGWADSVDQGIEKINKILPSNIILKKLAIADQPVRQLPLAETPANVDELRWWYDRRIGQIHCLKLACDLITEQYDIIVRVRLDGCLDREINLLNIVPDNNEIVFCNNLVGVNQSEPNDQFFIGKHDEIKFLCNLYNDFDKYMIESCSNWTNDVHNWALEYIIGTYLKSNGKFIRRGDFNHDINRTGRSAYTIDKHQHVHIAKDPTE